MKNYDDLMDLVSTIENLTEKVQKLDMNDLDDLKEAYNTVDSIEENLNKVWDECPWLKLSFAFITDLLGLDLPNDLSEWKESIKRHIDELEKDECENDDKCCCTCECPECESFDECFNDFFGEEYKYSPIDENYVREFLDMYAKDYNNSRKADETYYKLITNYINENCDYLNYLEESGETENERDEMIFTLYDFINYTMNR